jgi:hypothetical protein
MRVDFPGAALVMELRVTIAGTSYRVDLGRPRGRPASVLYKLTVAFPGGKIAESQRKSDRGAAVVPVEKSRPLIGGLTPPRSPHRRVVFPAVAG